jgi:N-acetyl-anhydromuramyl-L-alanine amidase AmpD
MKRLLYIFLFTAFSCFGQYETAFQSAYSAHPTIPKGVLEAVAYTNTHIRNISFEDQVSCSGMPLPFGVMGVFENGENYFLENGKTIASLSGFSVEAQKLSVETQILGYASAFDVLFHLPENASTNLGEQVHFTLLDLSEIPDSGLVNHFAREIQSYEILHFLMDNEMANRFGFTVYQFNLRSIFGTQNLNILRAKTILISETGIQNEQQQSYIVQQNKSTQYGPAIWNPAPSCNISSRAGTPVTAITIHTIQGSYAGAISWSQNCASSVSYHYVVRSSDGQITQMVDEADKAWHVGSENPYTIGYEHEGYITDPSWYTQAMYEASADLSRDIVNSGYGIPALRTYYGIATVGTNLIGGCTKIKGHQHYPNQTHTDPGINWDWEKYYRLINNNPTITTLTTTSGSFNDTGGNGANYSDDERNLWLFQPNNATSITLNFTSFSTELNYDYMFIYDGNSIDAPLIGQYSGTTSPGTITSTGGSILVEFRSDCGTTAAGWAVNWTSVIPNTVPPTTSIANLNDWKTADWNVSFTDNAVTSVSEKYFLAGAKPSGYSGWKANTTLGFLNEDFQDNAADWISQTDSWNLVNSAFINSDIALSNTNVSISLVQNNLSDYLYHWKQTITSTGANQRAGLHFFCDDATLPNRGNSYFVYFRNSTNKAEIYEVVNDVFTMQTVVNCIVNTNEQYDYKVTYSPTSGWIRVFVNDVFICEWQDPTPLTSGNSVSLRTGNCLVEYDNVRVYQSRSGNETISVGPTSAFFTQSENSSNAGLVRSFVLDTDDLWSTEAYELYKVDWTAPTIQSVNDGNSADIDTTYLTTLEGNWLTEDLHSGVSQAEVAIGTTLNGTDVLNWTVNATNAISHVLMSPVYDQLYFISVRATNGANLQDSLTSNGQRLLEEPSTAKVIENLLENCVIYPNPTSDVLFVNNLSMAVDLEIYSMDGKRIMNVNNYTSGPIQLPEVSNGYYQLVVKKDSVFKVIKIEILR